MSSLTYDQMANAILNYYSSGSTIWSKVNLGTASSAEILQAFSNIPQLQAVTSTSGVVLGYDYAEPLRQVVTYSDDIASAFNSNIGTGSYSDGVVDALIPANFGGGGGSAYTVASGAATSGGLIANILSTPVSPLAAVGGVSLACKLGAKIDSALYNLFPDFWDTVLPTWNPETWSTIAGTNSLGQSVIRTLFGIDSAGNSTAYMSSDVLAYTYMMLRDLGILSGGGMSYPTYKITGSYTISSIASGVSVLNDALNHITRGITYADGVFSGRMEQFINQHPNSIVMIHVATGTGSFGGGAVQILASQNPYSAGDTINLSTAIPFDRLVAQGTGTTGNPIKITGYSTSTQNSRPYVGSLEQPGNYDVSNIDATEIPSTPGITPNGAGTTPDSSLITGTTVDEVISQLKQNYPDLFDGSITSSVLQPDGSIKDFEYVPVPWMDNTTQTTAQPTTGTKTQTQTTIDPDTFTELVPSTPTGTSTNPPDTGDGDTPPSAVPTGSASSLWAVYNPTQAELNSFGSWLWSSNFVDQIKKLFNDPMQAILGVHKVFATPQTSGSQNIKCGYLDSGVSASVVSSQYTTVDCGSASLLEYFGNVFDYAPHTRVMLFLPFIGIVPLDTATVMRSTIKVKYTVDVITGACIAEVTVTRDGAGGILYTYGGSAIVSYPISSGSYMGVVTSALTTALGVAAGVATGGMALPAAASIALHGVTSAKTQVQHSGQFSGSSGAMGGKKPYLIILRPQTKVPLQISDFAGIPSNEYAPVGSCSGYVRFKDVHVKINGALDYELEEIEDYLKTGVII